MEILLQSIGHGSQVHHFGGPRLAFLADLGQAIGGEEAVEHRLERGGAESPQASAYSGG